MVVRDTSLASYVEEKKSGRLSEREQWILEWMDMVGPCTDRELAKHMGFNDPNMIRPRRKELVDKGLVVEAGKRKCGVSGKTSIVWEKKQKKW